MSEEPPNPILQTAWNERARWSDVATREKASITKARKVALFLGVAGAIFAMAASQTVDASEFTSRSLSLVGAAILAIAPFIAKNYGQDRVSVWIRARSASESLKREAFLYLTKTIPYASDNAEQILMAKTQEVTQKMDDLRLYLTMANSSETPIPSINSAADYIRNRVDSQIESFYRKRARELSEELKGCNTAATSCTILAALIGVTVTVFPSNSVGAWTAVATTIAGAIVAFAAAARYEHLIPMYESTATQLEFLRSSFLAGAQDQPTFSKFVQECESVISIESQAWMADWQKSSTAPQPTPASQPPPSTAPLDSAHLQTR